MGLLPKVLALVAHGYAVRFAFDPRVGALTIEIEFGNAVNRKSVHTGVLCHETWEKAEAHFCSILEEIRRELFAGFVSGIVDERVSRPDYLGVPRASAAADDPGISADWSRAESASVAECIEKMKRSME